jgi:hypothetical protein
MELAANHRITQIVEVVTDMEKRDRMIKHLEKTMENKENKILIFVGTKRIADEITRFLRQDGWPALCEYHAIAPSLTNANFLQPFTVTSSRTSVTGSLTNSRPESHPSWWPLMLPRVVLVCIILPPPPSWQLPATALAVLYSRI